MKKAEASATQTSVTPVRSATAVRGKYYDRLAKGTNLVILDSALVDKFPNSESVNVALRAFLSLPAEERAAAIQQARENAPRTEYGFDPRVGDLENAS